MMTSARRCRLGAKPASAQGGFTLVEMLVVVMVMAILAVLAMPAVKGLLGSMDLKGGANIVTAQLELARQIASTRNVQVDVRIDQDTSTIDPNATPANSPAYRIVSVVIPGTPNGKTNDEFLSPGVSLPGDIVFDQTAAYSTLLDPTQLDTSGVPRAVVTEPTTVIAPATQLPPKRVSGLKYMKITYLPNGTLNLVNTTATSGAWCLSIRNLQAKAVGAAPNGKPAVNFISLVLDPATSRARLYQP